MSKIFVDTPVLVRAADNMDPAKRGKSRNVLGELRDKRNGVVSTQILQEFYEAAVKHLGTEPLVAKGIVHALRNFETVLVDEDLIEEAVDCSILNRLPFRNALVVVSAEKAHCRTLWTEELKQGQTIRGVRVENPFADL